MLALEEGIFGVFSAGANLAGALAPLSKREKGQTIAMSVCDPGL